MDRPEVTLENSDAVYDFTFTATSAPGLEDRQLYPLCCRFR